MIKLNDKLLSGRQRDVFKFWALTGKWVYDPSIGHNPDRLFQHKTKFIWKDSFQDFEVKYVLKSGFANWIKGNTKSKHLSKKENLLILYADEYNCWHSFYKDEAASFTISDILNHTDTSGRKYNTLEFLFLSDTYKSINSLAKLHNLWHTIGDFERENFWNVLKLPLLAKSSQQVSWMDSDKEAVVQVCEQIWLATTLENMVSSNKQWGFQVDKIIIIGNNFTNCKEFIFDSINHICEDSNMKPEIIDLSEDDERIDTACRAGILNEKGELTEVYKNV